MSFFNVTFAIAEPTAAHLLATVSASGVHQGSVPGPPATALVRLWDTTSVLREISVGINEPPETLNTLLTLEPGNTGFSRRSM